MGSIRTHVESVHLCLRRAGGELNSQGSEAPILLVEGPCRLPLASFLKQHPPWHPVRSNAAIICCNSITRFSSPRSAILFPYSIVLAFGFAHNGLTSTRLTSNFTTIPPSHLPPAPQKPPHPYINLPKPLQTSQTLVNIQRKLRPSSASNLLPARRIRPRIRC